MIAEEIECNPSFARWIVDLCDLGGQPHRTRPSPVSKSATMTRPQTHLIALVKTTLWLSSNGPTTESPPSC